MNKLYFTIIKFCDENEYEFEAEVLYYVDKCLDTGIDFIDDFEMRNIDCINKDENSIPLSIFTATRDYYEIIMDAILDNPGYIAEEF